MNDLSESPINPTLETPFIIAPIGLAIALPDRFAAPKFTLGQQVRWARIPSQDIGTIIGFLYAQSISVHALGYHYAIAFDDNSPARSDCVADWGFEDDLELVPTPLVTPLIARGGNVSN